MAEKYMWKTSIFKNVTSFKNISKVSPHFKKIVSTLRQVFQTYSEIRIFYVMQYVDFQKQSVEVFLKC